MVVVVVVVVSTSTVTSATDSMSAVMHAVGDRGRR